jgi:hypothetical protein
MMLRNMSLSILVRVFRVSRPSPASGLANGDTSIDCNAELETATTRSRDPLQPISTATHQNLMQHEYRPVLHATALPHHGLRRRAVTLLVLAITCATVLPEARQSDGVRLARLGSPTGREPRLIWTGERQAIWSQMRADFEANPSAPPTLGGQYYKLIKDNAECKCRYGDTGLWAALMFQITGDRKYVDLAWAEVESSFLKLTGRQLGGNYAREYAAENVLLYDWLYPALSSAQRSTFLSKLNEQFDVALTNTSSPNAPVRTTDSDQTVGVYFGLAFLFVATGDHNPRANEFINRPYIGGLSSTGRDRTTLRNTILDYVQMAKGGEWIEGSDYSLGTVRLLLLGAEGVRTATGKEYFPEIAQWISQAATRPLYVITPDLRQSYQWGDTEHPGIFQGRLAAWQTTNGILAGLADATSAPFAQDLVVRLVNRYGVAGYQSAEPLARMFLTFNPYTETAPSHTLPRTWFAPGQGLLTMRTGWDEGASMFGAHVPAQQLQVDHQVAYLGDFQLYRRGAWAITHPLTYGGPGIAGEGVNTLLHAGFGSMVQLRDVAGAEWDAGETFAYIAGTTGGQKYSQGSYQPPPTYLHEWTRSLVYLPALTQGVDAIVVYDRSHAEHPRQLPRFERYSTADRNTITGAASLREWLIHTPVQPAISADTIAWRTPAGDALTVQMLLPRERKVTTVDESQKWSESSVRADQRKWNARISPATEQPWVTFLNVVQAHGDAPPAVVDLLTSPDGVEGTVVRRAGAPDAVVLFNALPSPRIEALPNGLGSYDIAHTDQIRRARLRSTGFTIQWQGSTASTQVIIADLDPAKPWRYRLNNGESRVLPVTQSGLAVIDATGARAHTITVS